MKTKGQESTQQQGLERTQGGVPAVLDFSGDAGKGNEGADNKSFAVPFIKMLQGNSPEIDKLDDAKPGLIINSITNELMREVFVVPCAFSRKFLRWAPRESGGGYRGEYPALDIDLNKVEGVVMSDDGQRTINGDLLRDTRNHYVLMQSAESGGQWQPAVLSLTSTQIKKSKRWMTRIQGIEMRDGNGKAFNPPSFSHIYKCTPVKEENSEGSWWGWSIELVGPITDGELYGKAKTFHARVAAGEVETAPPVEEQPQTGAADGRF